MNTELPTINGKKLFIQITTKRNFTGSGRQGQKVMNLLSQDLQKKTTNIQKTNSPKMVKQ